jgi:signal transduction histidine kinase
MTMLGPATLAPGGSARPSRLAPGPSFPAERALVWVSWLVGYLLFAAVLLRCALDFAGTPDLVPALLLLGVYFALYASLDRVARRAAWYPAACLGLQTVVVTALLALPAFPDFVAILFAALAAQAARHFSPRPVIGWIALFAAVMFYFLLSRWGVAGGLAGAVVYLAVTGIVAAYGLTCQRALAARARSQALQRDLEAAARQLAAHAARQEQLSAARERSRLARELHDSVTQTIFSLTLTAQAALLLADRDPGRVGAQLDRLETLAGSALAELRSLVAHLGPAGAARGGLLAALEQHAAARRAQDGLAVTLEVEAPGRLRPAEEANLFRIVQEALNNVAKHAGTDRATVSVRLAAPAWVQVRDEGRGFPAGQAAGAGHLGLAHMRARAEEIGWRLVVTSAPGAGTCLRVEQPGQESNDER